MNDPRELYSQFNQALEASIPLARLLEAEHTNEFNDILRDTRHLYRSYAIAECILGVYTS